MTLGVKKLVHAGPRESQAELPPGLKLPGETLEAGKTILAEGLGLPRSEVTVVSPTLGVVGHHLNGAEAINRTSIKNALK